MSSPRPSPTKRSKYSRWTRSTVVVAAASARAACATPSGLASPRSFARRLRNASSGARTSSAASRAYSCARAASTSSRSIPLACWYRSGRSAPRLTPVIASTWSTRSAGTRSQFETEGCEMPIFRASSVTPPTACSASLRPGWRIVPHECSASFELDNSKEANLVPVNSARLYLLVLSGQCPTVAARDPNGTLLHCRFLLHRSSKIVAFVFWGVSRRRKLGFLCVTGRRRSCPLLLAYGFSLRFIDSCGDAGFPLLERAKYIDDQPGGLVPRQQRPEARHPVGSGEVPRVLGQPHEVANRRVGAPCAA